MKGGTVDPEDLEVEDMLDELAEAAMQDALEEDLYEEDANE